MVVRVLGLLTAGMRTPRVPRTRTSIPKIRTAQIGRRTTGIGHGLVMNERDKPTTTLGVEGVAVRRLLTKVSIPRVYTLVYRLSVVALF